MTDAKEAYSNRRLYVVPNLHRYNSESANALPPYCCKCGAPEDGQPTECPRSLIHGEDLDKIKAGTLDFIGGKWVRKYAND